MSTKTEVAAVQPSSMSSDDQCEPGSAAASAANASATSAAVKQEDWSLPSPFTLDQLQQQFRESVHSERRAATEYLLTQGMLLLRLLEQTRCQQPRDYGQLDTSQRSALTALLWLPSRHSSCLFEFVCAVRAMYNEAHPLLAESELVWRCGFVCRLWEAREHHLFVEVRHSVSRLDFEWRVNGEKSLIVRVDCVHGVSCFHSSHTPASPRYTSCSSVAGRLWRTSHWCISVRDKHVRTRARALCRCVLSLTACVASCAFSAQHLPFQESGRNNARPQQRRRRGWTQRLEETRVGGCDHRGRPECDLHAIQAQGENRAGQSPQQREETEKGCAAPRYRSSSTTHQATAHNKISRASTCPYYLRRCCLVLRRCCCLVFLRCLSSRLQSSPLRCLCNSR
jgi:hypothetical protein